MIELLLQAEVALSLGLLDRAETLYRQVAGADPRNSIAVVGLARVTLERRDERGALELAMRALAIDPDNAAAQRMVQRLEEVLMFRGVDLSAGTGEVPARLPEVTTKPAEVPARTDELPARTDELPASPPAPDPGAVSGANQDVAARALPAPTAPPRRRSLVHRLLRRR